MKKRIVILLLCMAIMAILPLIAMKKAVNQPERHTENARNEFRILDTSSNQIVSIDEREFCIGAVGYEMPSDFQKEALKAQCIACYTYFSEMRQNSDKEYDFSADLSKNQFYIKDLSDESRKKISQAVDEVFKKVLTDKNGNMIKIAYHAISSGQTESAKDIFGFESDYLQPVSSAGDVNVSGYLSQKEISVKRFKEIMLSKNIQLDGEPDTWIGDMERTQSGTVKLIQIGDKTISGADIREMFSLRSANFDVSYSNNKFILLVYGYGHGVGMSQYGAESMAKQGAGCEEILHHYYGNCNIQKIDSQI